MKTLPLVAINVVTVVAALAAYDFLKEPGSAMAPTPASDLGVLEARVASLEERGPSTEGARLDELSDRISHLERRIEDDRMRRPPPPEHGGMTEGFAADGTPESAEEAARVAALRTRETDLEKRVTDAEGRVAGKRGQTGTSRLDRALESRGLQLTAEQKEQVSTTMATFRDKVREKLRALRESGGGREGTTTAMDEMRTNLRSDLEAFLTPADAAAIVDEMAAPPGGRTGGQSGGGRQSPRRR